LRRSDDDDDPRGTDELDGVGEPLEEVRRERVDVRGDVIVPGLAALVDVGGDACAGDRLPQCAEGGTLAAVQEVLRACPQLGIGLVLGRDCVGAGFDTDAMPAIGTGSNVSAAAGRGSFSSRSRAETRIEPCPGLNETLSIVSYSVLPSAVATRVPAGIVSSPGAACARVNSTSPAGRPPRTRSIPSSATTLSSASPVAVSTKPAW
jgi:hypothetical protein